MLVLIVIGSPSAYESPEPFANVFQPLNSKPARNTFVLLGTAPAVLVVKITEASLPVPPFALNESSEEPSGIP